MGINHTFIKHQFNINGWIAKATLQPFECVEIYEQPLCLVILIINNNGSDPKLLQSGELIQRSSFNYDKYLEIINLQQKMLTVLDLPKNLLTKITLRTEKLEQFSQSYAEPSKQSQFKNFLTKKILDLIQPKVILQFGFIDLLSYEFLKSKKIPLIKTFDPFYLLLNPQDKRQAHKDLLLCKAHIAKLIA